MWKRVFKLRESATKQKQGRSSANHGCKAERPEARGSGPFPHRCTILLLEHRTSGVVPCWLLLWGLSSGDPGENAPGRHTHSVAIDSVIPAIGEL